VLSANLHTEEIAQGLLRDPHYNYNILPAPQQEYHSNNQKFLNEINQNFQKPQVFVHPINQ
jgi:hypothetical protein